MKSNKSIITWSVVVVLVLIILFAWPQINNPKRGLVKKINEAGIDCMGGHSRAIQHIHSHLTILMDDREEIIPSNIGLIGSCMAEIHTHDTSGKIHIESLSSNKTFTIKDFFTVWGKSIEREGYNLEIRADGLPVNSELGESLILKDEQKIILKYSKKITAQSTSAVK